MESGTESNTTIRRHRHAIVSRFLEGRSDDELASIVGASEPLGSGIGGARSLMHVGDVPVFVKRVPLTERELAPDGLQSTANIFDLPMACHYGIASPGFGAWREVAANEMTTRLVLDGTAEAFPILYHWRIQDARPEATAISAVIDEVARLWRGTPAVEHRLAAITSAPATVLLFFEYIPETLPKWLEEQANLGQAAKDEAVTMAETSLLSGVAEMKLAGLLHFDAHLDNVLTDGSRVYFADFGLATSPHFPLTERERQFIERNETYDTCLTMTRLVDWIVSALTDAHQWTARDRLIQRVRDGNRRGVEHLSPAVAAVIERHSPIAAIINDFHRQLRFDDRYARYPQDAIRQALEGH